MNKNKPFLLLEKTWNNIKMSLQTEKENKVLIPILETKRLILRAIEPKDAKDVFEYAGDIENTQYMPWNTHSSVDDTNGFIDYCQKRCSENMCLDYGITLKENGKLIGTGGAFSLEKLPHCVEIGYIINKRYWGQGITVEAMTAVVDYLFNVLNVHRIEAYHYIENKNSGKVMLKLGMKYEGIQTDKLYLRGRYFTTAHYAIINPKHL